MMDEIKRLVKEQPMVALAYIAIGGALIGFLMWIV